MKICNYAFKVTTLPPNKPLNGNFTNAIENDLKWNHQASGVAIRVNIIILGKKKTKPSSAVQCILLNSCMLLL